MTLAYSIAREGGKVEPLMGAQDLERLASHFTTGMVLQGRYVLERELGRGAMGLVFLGRDNRLGRPVAIKAILPSEGGWRMRGSATEEQFQDRFLEEAKIGANLTHPAIATVHDFGYHDGTPFTIFEYVAGPMLYDVIKRRGNLPLEEVRLIVGQLARALDFAHSRFVVHRDLKPANIKSTAEGDFKILDLGLATEFRRQSNWSFCGTPAYASPEQAAGLSTDGRSDQYALALIAWEMLAGRRPFVARDVGELLEMHRKQEPPSLCELAPWVPAPVEGALHRALSKRPDDRYPTCTQFAAAIGSQILSGQPSPPEILLEGDVGVKYTGSDRFRFQIGGRREVHLVLSGDSLWSLRGVEVRCTPLGLIDYIKHQPSGRRLDIHEARGIRSDEVRSFVFRSREECRTWVESLRSGQGRAKATSGDDPGAGGVSGGPVVLVQRQPNQRYQLLGQVEAHDRRRKTARAGMVIRARMLGAEAVVDHLEERVSGPKRHLWRSTGSGIRPVDAAGRGQLKSRWFDSQIRRWTSFCFVFLVVNFFALFLVHLALSALTDSLDRRGELFGPRYGTGALAVLFLCTQGLMHLVVFGFSMALRHFRRGGLVKPTAAAVMILGAVPAGLSLGRLLGAFQAQSIDLIAVNALSTLGSLVPFAYCLYLRRKLWGLYSDYLSLSSDSDRPPPQDRMISSRLAYALALASFFTIMIIAGSERAAHTRRSLDPRSDPSNSREVIETYSLFDRGVANSAVNPAEAESAFKEALTRLNRLAVQLPDDPWIRINKARALMNLAIIAQRSNRYGEAVAWFRESATIFEARFADKGVLPEVKKNLADAKSLLSVLLATSPDPKYVNRDEALRLARSSIELDRDNPEIWLRRGVVEMNSGNPRAAAGSFEKAMGLRNGGEAREWFLMAEALAVAGDRGEAIRWFEKAASWAAAHRPDDPVLQNLRAEAASLLGGTN